MALTASWLTKDAKAAICTWDCIESHPIYEIWSLKLWRAQTLAATAFGLLELLGSESKFCGQRIDQAKEFHL